MKNELYRKCLAPASNAPDGDTPCLITLTEEVNCYIVWLSSYSVANTVLKSFESYERDRAIEWAVQQAPSERLALEARIEYEPTTKKGN